MEKNNSYIKPDLIKNDMGGKGNNLDSRMREIFDLLEYIPEEMNSFLDVGFGRGQISSYLRRKGKRVTGIGLELASYGLDLDIVEEGIQLIEANVENMPFENCSFDCVIASHILEHVSNMGNALKEISRVLEEKGILIVFIPKFSDYVCAGHVNTGWNLGQLMYVLLINGFDVKHGKFIEYGYSLCAMVKKSNYELPPLRGDRGDIHILNEKNLFPMRIQSNNGICDGYNGNIQAINWKNAERLIKVNRKKDNKKVKFMRLVKRILEICIGQSKCQTFGRILLESHVINPKMLQ